MENSKLIENNLKKYNQEHILDEIDKMDLSEKKDIINKLLKIDFEEMNELYKSTQKELDIKHSKITPMEYIDKAKIPENEKKEIIQIGENIIKHDEYAVVTMAGGQGTRLRI